MAARDLLARIPHPTVAEIQRGPGRQPVPVRLLRADHRGGAARPSAAAETDDRPGRRVRAALGGAARVTGALPVPRRHPAARRAAGQARHPRLRAGQDPLDRHQRAPGECPASCLVMTAADLPQPVPAVRAAVPGPPGPGRRRDEVPRRAGGRGGGRDAGRRGGGRPPGPGRLRGAAGRRHARRRAGRPARRWCRIRTCGPATRWPARTCCTSTGTAGVTSSAADSDLVVVGHLHLPDGHPLRDRARMRFMAAPGRRRHHDLEHDPAPVLAAADHRRAAAACRWRRSG